MKGLPLQNYSFVAYANNVLSRTFPQSARNATPNYNQSQITKNGNNSFDASYITRQKKLFTLLKNKINN